MNFCCRLKLGENIGNLQPLSRENGFGAVKEWQEHNGALKYADIG